MNNREENGSLKRDHRKKENKNAFSGGPTFSVGTLRFAPAYGVENEPVLTYGTVKVSMGSLEFLTQKVERLAKIKPQLQGMEGTLHLENWTEETTNIVFDKTESSKKDNKKS